MLDDREPCRSLKRRLQNPNSTPSQLESRLANQAIAHTQVNTTAHQAVDTDFDMEYEQAEYYLNLHDSQEEASGSDGMSSFFNVMTPSATTEGSYDLVRGYSDNSNQTREVSENQLYSTPSNGTAEHAWITGAEFAVDTEASMPHDREVLFFDMNLEPKPKHDPYQNSKTSNIGKDVEDQEYMENYRTHGVSHSRNIASSSRPSKLQRGSEDPWSHVDSYGVPRSVPGIVAFAPSPGPMVDQELDDIHAAHEVPLQRRHNIQPIAPKENMSPNRNNMKGVEKYITPRWENAFVCGDELVIMSEHNGKEATPRRMGVRKGRLNPQVKEKARRIRKLKACWKCRTKRVTCSEGQVCEACMKQFSSLAARVCCRTGLPEYSLAFFPDYLHSHLSKKEIEDLITDHTSYFLDPILEVDLSSGSCFKPLRLETNEFVPKDGGLTSHFRLAMDGGEQGSQLVQQYSAPIGIICLSLPELKRQCKRHIEEMIKDPQYPVQATLGHKTYITQTILEIVSKYSVTKDKSLVQDAMILHGIHYFMRSLLTLTDESVAKLHARNPSLAGTQRGQYISSRLLNRQVKFAMNLLHREMYKGVLEGLEKSMKSRSKDSWGPSFCALLVLCLCIEELETAADTFIICDIQKERGYSKYNRKYSLNACEALEEHPFHQCTTLFHDIYHSHREANGGSKQSGYNPLRSLHSGAGSLGLDQPTDTMVKSIFGIVTNSYDKITELSERPMMVNHGYEIDPREIIDNNMGRVASKFLRSFFEKMDPF